MEGSEKQGKPALNRGEIYYYLRSRLPRDEQALLSRLLEIRSRRGNQVWAAGLITLSNFCVRNCVFCAFRAEQSGFRRFRLSRSEIFSAVELAQALGLRWLILKAGDDPAFDPALIAEVIRELKTRHGFTLSLALGERTPAVYDLWQKAGADSYWLRHETCDQHIYRRVRPSMFWVDRMQAFSAIKSRGWRLASGILIGMPNQSYENLVEDLVFFSEQNMVGAALEPYLPPPGSPGAELIQRPENLIVSPDLPTLTRIITLTRLLSPEIVILITNLLITEREALDSPALLTAGANAILFDLTPVEISTLERKAPFAGYPLQHERELSALRERLQSFGFELSLRPPPFTPSAG